MVSTKRCSFQFTMMLGYSEILGTGNLKYFLFLGLHYIHLVAKIESVLI